MLHDRAVLASLNISQPKLRAKDKAASTEICDAKGASRSQAAVIKKLFAEDDYRPISRIIASIRNDVHYHMTAPWGQDGARILPSAAFMRYSERMREMEGKFWLLVEEFVANYADRLSKAAALLGALHRDADYPSPSAIRGEFGFSVSFAPVPVASDFRCQGIDEAVKAELDASMREQEARALRDAMTSLAKRITEAMSNAASVLSKDKPKIHDSLVANIRALADVIPDLNMGEDPVVEEVGNIIRDVFENTSVEGLKNSPAERAEVVGQIDDIIARMSGLV